MGSGNPPTSGPTSSAGTDGRGGGGGGGVGSGGGGPGPAPSHGSPGGDGVVIVRYKFQ